jgi:phage tail sheath protein FI
MTQNDVDNGRLICLVGVAPLCPAEFVIFRIGIWTQCPPNPLGD